jgi:hypothetical protein
MRRGVFALLVLVSPWAAGQNVLSDATAGPVLEPVRLDLADAARMVDELPEPAAGGDGERRRVLRVRLNDGVREWLEGHPWAPFQHTIGISGHEWYFDHPADVFHALSVALPELDNDLAARVREVLMNELAVAPPWRKNGYERESGRAREFHDVPESVRLRGAVEAASSFGVHAFWSLARQLDDRPLVERYWPELRARMAEVLAAGAGFEPAAGDLKEHHLERLNGDIAGLAAFVRMARLVGDADSAEAGLEGLRGLLELRVNHERVNPVMEVGGRKSTRSLHYYKVARYALLVPGLAEAMKRHAGPVAAERLRVYRDARPGWFMADGDRLIGGENRTNPVDFRHHLFLAAALLERMPMEQLAEWVDVPWCRGDLHQIERLALVLAAGAE